MAVDDAALAAACAGYAHHKTYRRPAVPLPDEVLRAAAGSGDLAVRWELGDYAFVLPTDVFLALIDDPDKGVRESTIMHRPATTSQLELALSLRPEFEEQVILHDHAPLRLMDRRPIGVTDGPLRRHYLDQHGASEAERSQFLSLCHDSPPDEDLTVTLGDLWEIIRPR